NRRVGDARSRLCSKEIERASDAQEQHLWIIRWIVEILHAYITPREKVGKGFDVRRAKNLPTEGTDHRRADGVRITENERLHPPVKVWVCYRDERLAIIIAWSIQARHLKPSKQRL